MLTGGKSSHYTRKFETVSSAAGAKLQDLPSESVKAELLSIKNPTHRWYEALKEYSGEYEFGFVATQNTESGELIGHIYTGTLHHPVEASSNLALMLSTIKVPKKQSLLNSVNDFFVSEASNRKYLWSFLAFAVMVFLAILAL